MVGWRDDAGIVERIETLHVSSLPKRGMEWRANVCANFLLEFISFIQQNLLRDSSDQVYYFTFFLIFFSLASNFFYTKSGLSTNRVFVRMMISLPKFHNIY